MRELPPTIRAQVRCLAWRATMGPCREVKATVAAAGMWGRQCRSANDGACCWVWPAAALTADGIGLRSNHLPLLTASLAPGVPAVVRWPAGANASVCAAPGCDGGSGAVAAALGGTAGWVLHAVACPPGGSAAGRLAWEPWDEGSWACRCRALWQSCWRLRCKLLSRPPHITKCACRHCLPCSPTGQVIVQQGHVLQSIWFVRRGFVDLSVAVAPSQAGSEPGGAEEGASSRLVDTLGPGDFFADRALLPEPKEAAKKVRFGGGGWNRGQCR